MFKKCNFILLLLETFPAALHKWLWMFAIFYYHLYKMLLTQNRPFQWSDSNAAVEQSSHHLRISALSVVRQFLDQNWILAETSNVDLRLEEASHSVRYILHIYKPCWYISKDGNWVVESGINSILGYKYLFAIFSQLYNTWRRRGRERYDHVGIRSWFFQTFELVLKFD